MKFIYITNKSMFALSGIEIMEKNEVLKHCILK